MLVPVLISVKIIRANAFGGYTSSEETGNNTRTYISPTNIEEHRGRHLIYRYDGKTYK